MSILLFSRKDAEAQRTDKSQSGSIRMFIIDRFFIVLAPSMTIDFKTGRLCASAGDILFGFKVLFQSTFSRIQLNFKPKSR